MELLLRRMTQEDIPAIVQLEQLIFTDPWSYESFLSTINSVEDIYLVATEENRIVGYCGMWGVAGEGQITNVAVAPDYRRHGIGKRLLLETLKIGKAAGLKEFTLEARVGNTAAIHLYEGLGFLPVGVRKGFYSHPKEDALIMWLR